MRVALEKLTVIQKVKKIFAYVTVFKRPDTGFYPEPGESSPLLKNPVV